MYRGNGMHDGHLADVDSWVDHHATANMGREIERAHTPEPVPAHRVGGPEHIVHGHRDGDEWATIRHRLTYTSTTPVAGALLLVSREVIREAMETATTRKGRRKLGKLQQTATRDRKGTNRSGRARTLKGRELGADLALQLTRLDGRTRAARLIRGALEQLEA